MEVYKITNVVNGKCYIGQTSRHFRKRYNHRDDWWNAPSVNELLKNATVKYGPHNFIVEIVFVTDDRETLLQKEIELISLHNSMAPNGYNLTPGGDGGFSPTTDAIEKNRRAHQGRPASGRAAKGMKKPQHQIDKRLSTIKARYGKLEAWNKGLKVGPMPKESINKSAKAHQKMVICLNPITGESKIYRSLKATEADGFNSCQVSGCCKHPEKYKSHKGHNWAYLESSRSS